MEAEARQAGCTSTTLCGPGPLLLAFEPWSPSSQRGRDMDGAVGCFY